jgi:secondary thiamine-phosphate synthase enzyme
MNQYQHAFHLATRGQGLYDFTGDVVRWLGECGVRDGLLTLFVRHTSASLILQENADPDVQGDLQRFLARLVPENDPLYRHTQEGPDDMPAHIRAVLTQTQLSIPVRDGNMVLGTWQGIFLFEHRRSAHRREVAGHLLGVS